MNIKFSSPTEYDRQKFEDTLSLSCLDGRVKITARDDNGNTAELFIEQEIVERLGKDYIQEHTTMYYDKALDDWFLKMSQNDFYNNTERNPEKVIQVKFDSIEGGTGREIYKGVETGRYYLRETYYPHETFARWYICGKHYTTNDSNEPRANLIFECNGQQEKVRYDDWNGVAAYGDTFNKNFNRGR